MRIFVWGINYAPEVAGIAPYNVAPRSAAKGKNSRARASRNGSSDSRVVVCDLVYAEVSTLYSNEKELDEDLAAFGLAYDVIPPSTAFLASLSNAN